MTNDHKIEIFFPHALTEQYAELRSEYMKPQIAEWRKRFDGWFCYEEPSMLHVYEGLITTVEPEFIAFLDERKFAYVLASEEKFTVPGAWGKV